MKKLLVPSLFLSFVFGCSSNIQTTNLNQFSNYTGGQSMGDTSSFYWYTDRVSAPHSAADYVSAGDYGWYQSDYHWEEGALRELIREGQQLKDEALVPYRIHMRFNKAGEAIYQQYRLDGKVLPLKADKIAWLKQEAQNIPTRTKELSANGMRLIQGYWDGSSFDTCSGQSYEQVEFNETLPSFVINRLATVDSYAAFLGNTKGNKVIVNELLMLDEDSHDCIERPVLIKR